jgi:hydrogenase maturation protein HypF
MLFEALAAGYQNIDNAPVTELKISNQDGIYLADWETLIPVLTDDSIPVEERAAGFHVSMAQTLLRLALQVRRQTGVNAIGLAGGVFQNRVLTEKVISLLRNEGFATTMPLLMPVNDASISFGQIVDYGYNNG